MGGVGPVVRWYDARQRTSLKIVAAWLRVPWHRVVGFECLLVYQLMLPQGEGGPPRAQMTPWEKSMRAAKIGAATLAVGGVFALTGLHSSPCCSLALFVACSIGMDKCVWEVEGKAVLKRTKVAAFCGILPPNLKTVYFVFGRSALQASKQCGYLQSV